MTRFSSLWIARINFLLKPILWQVKAEGEINPFFPLDT